MRERSRIQLGAIEQVQRAFAAAPHQEVKDVDKSEAIRMLVPDIEAMKSKGYSLVDIAGVLSDNGVPITPTVLKNYLGLAKGRASVRKGHNKRPRGGQASGNARVTRFEAAPPAATHVVGKEAERASSAAREEPAPVVRAVGKEVAGKLAESAPADDVHVVERTNGVAMSAARKEPSKSVAQRPSMGAAIRNEPLGQSAEESARRSAFIPRDDSEDI